MRVVQIGGKKEYMVRHENIYEALASIVCLSLYQPVIDVVGPHLLSSLRCFLSHLGYLKKNIFCCSNTYYKVTSTYVTIAMSQKSKNPVW